MASSKFTFLVPGSDRATTTRGGAHPPDDVAWPPLRGFAHGRLKHSITLSATRAGAETIAVEAVPGSDMVVIEIAGGPTLVLHPETAAELLSAQAGVRERGSSGDAASLAGTPVPLRLQWAGANAGPAGSATRGGLGDVLVKGFHVVSDYFKGPAASYAATKIAKKVDAQVANAVYALRRESLPVLKEAGTPLAQLPDDSVAGPALVLLHGTFSSTQGTFQKLWTMHPQHVASLFDYYGNRVYALDHPTLGESPIENALTLVRTLRKGTRLHLVTHSRGGLVAEVLAKVCANPRVSAADLALFPGGDYKAQREALRSLAKLVAERDVKVERIVRVACPVRGTLLASKRLDAYVSVFKWSLELAGLPVIPAVVDFLGAVASKREDVDILPGLAAQIPDSPLVRWLHSSGDQVSGSLRVVAGDLAGDSVKSWVKTLLADAFYWTDNDLVVQTRGMYGGPPRASVGESRAPGATFLLDQGGDVSHFSYFANERTADAVVNALTQDAPAEFRPIGPESWAGKSSSGVRGLVGDGAPAALEGHEPIVILVPDLLGSHLKIGKDRVWLGERTSGDFGRLDWNGKESSKVEPDGLLGLYADLSKYLSGTHQVIEFAYDWRQPIEDAAEDLAGEIKRAVDAATRAKAPRPVRIVAHGMGGLLVRAFAMAEPRLWTKMLAHESARVLMLGVPHGGSWTPMQIMSGDETFGGLLHELGAPLPERSNRQITADWPGLIDLQAELTGDGRLNAHGTWQTLADQDVDRYVKSLVWHRSPQQKKLHEWGVPSGHTLERAEQFRRRLDEQAAAGFGVHASKLLCVVGSARVTPDGFVDSKQGFVYRDVIDGGDGFVTTERGVLPGVRAFRARLEHRALVTSRAAFSAFVELLDSGDTKAFERVTAGAARGASGGAMFQTSRPSRQPVTARPSESRDFMSASARTAATGSRETGPTLDVTVVNGNLRFMQLPLMLGHYRSVLLSGTEWVMDMLIGGTMSKLLNLGQYPDAPGSHKVFINQRNFDNPLALPRPAAVIVVGLGEEGKLTATDLIGTVRQGVIAWAHDLIARKSTPDAQFGLASTLIGSGGAGISAGQAALAIAQGVREANARLRDTGWPTVGHLQLVELYLDRANDAWNSLRVQGSTSGGGLRLARKIRQEPGWLRRPLDAGYRGANYDFVSAESTQGVDGSTSIAYRLDTKRARTEVHASAMQVPLLRELVTSASNDRNTDTQIGRTLFNLLIPPEVEPFLGGSTETVLEVDNGSAGIPWELLDTRAGTRDGGDPRPWSIRSKLLRKLRTSAFRPHVVDAGAEASVLVIGEPMCDRTKYGSLPGAAEEAVAVVQSFTGHSAEETGTSHRFPADRVRRLISKDGVGHDARSIVNAVHERDWRIVHIAGHGLPPKIISLDPANPARTRVEPGGVVLSNETFLGPHEINTMRVVPELVFVNCCYLAARDPHQLLKDDCGIYDRAGFAAGVAESLIEIGVRCVIAAGWAVEDEQAKEFARTFYDRLLGGSRFIDAVADARSKAQSLGGNTWAAYQCYGDPDWTFRWKTGDAQQQEPESDGRDDATTEGPSGKDGKPSGPTLRLEREFGSVASAQALVLALETIATLSKFGSDDDRKLHLTKIGFLEHHLANRFGRVGSVAEGFAHAWKESGNRVAAIRWYRRAVHAPDGSASMRATEQLGNLRARLALELVEKAQASRDSTRAKLAKEVKLGRERVEGACKLLEGLARKGPSVERLSLCGSAWKRRALIEQIGKDTDAETDALCRMRMWYRKAESLAQKERDPTIYYPALNRMAADLVIDGHTQGWKGFDAAAVARLKQSIESLIASEPEFWSVIARTELRLYEALAAGDLAAEFPTIKSEYDDVWSRVSASGAWDSVLVQMRFVLPKYVARLPREKEIAGKLLTHIEGLVKSARKNAPKS